MFLQVFVKEVFPPQDGWLKFAIALVYPKVREDCGGFILFIFFSDFSPNIT